MAFTYDILSADPDILLLSRVRRELSDNVEDAGVLPGGANLQDEEIALYLADNDNNVAATITALSTIIWRSWLGMVDVAVGPRRESLSQVAAHWQALAGGDGGGLASGVSFVAQPVRVDGYSENA